MKRLALVAAVVTFAACTAREEAPIDTAAAPPAMAPAPADTGMKMDTGAPMDTTMKKDTPASK